MEFFRWLVGDAFANEVDRNRDLANKLSDEISQLRRTLASCDNRESRLIETANETHEYAVWLHQMSFPGLDVPDTTIEIMTAIHRWMSAQSRELESLRAKIVESSDVKESIERTQEIVTELRDKMIAGDAITFPEPAANKLDELVREFIDLALAF